MTIRDCFIEWMRSVECGFGGRAIEGKVIESVMAGRVLPFGFIHLRRMEEFACRTEHLALTADKSQKAEWSENK
jgi:hypothetical protein